MNRGPVRAFLGVVSALCAACVSARHEAPEPRVDTARRGDEIVVCGRFFPTGTRVVLWNEPGGFDAYEGEPKFGARSAGSTLDDVRGAVHQVVLHYDVAGTSARCFRVLHRRGLSCHFLLDLDGTVYQTLDLKERAWHAAEANDGSVGVEIANIGAYRDAAELAPWYARDAEGARVTLPDGVERGALPAGFVARPARPDVVRGAIHGTPLHQYDFTEEQYEALGRLLAALCRALPGIAPEAPRGPGGEVATTVVPGAVRVPGILGHYHVTAAKVDPGPAFQWARVLGDVSRHLEG